MPRPRSARLSAASIVLLAGLAACSSTRATGVASRAGTTPAPSTSTTAAVSTVPVTPTSTSLAGPQTTTSPPPAVPAFTGTVSTLTAADLPSSWRTGCPVGPQQLRLLHLSYWGFDGEAHVGTMVVNAAATQAVITVFGHLYGHRFPIRQMVPIDAYGGSDPASTAADNTAAFNCRYAVARGAPQWSMHAYGEAIDVNPVENPYIEGGTVQPPAGAAYLNRSVYRPGMAVPGGELVVAFTAVGWGWGGNWGSTPDYQHFSVNGK